MTQDIVERLRERARELYGKTRYENDFDEAAAEIEKLRKERDEARSGNRYAQLEAMALRRAEKAEAEVERLRKALEPFARYLDRAAFDKDNKGNALPDDTGVGWVYLTVGDFHAARLAHGGNDE